MVKKIVLITPGQPSSNPRLMKEAICLNKEGYEVCVIFCYWSEWAEKYDQEIIDTYRGIQFSRVGGDPTHKIWMFSFTRLRHKLFRFLSRILTKSVFIAARSECRAYDEIKKSCLKIKADLYLAHHVGLLPIAYLAARYHHAKCGYDAEDFYRGMDVNNMKTVRNRVLLEDIFIPKFNYLTAASPQIAETYEKLYGRKFEVINNVFTIDFIQKEIEQEKQYPIRLFWFSQTIGKGRGIEDILQAMGCFESGNFQLTLLGQYNDEIKKYFEDYLIHFGGHPNDLIFEKPVSLKFIFEMAAKHDIGLAIEMNEELNRDLCLTNKLFTYLLAGNAVILSKTKAQDLFWKQHENIGFIYEPGNISELKQVLNNILDNPSVLKNCKKSSLNLAINKYNWEMESILFLKTIKTVLGIA